jgi:hypothetical protein
MTNPTIDPTFYRSAAEAAAAAPEELAYVVAFDRDATRPDGLSVVDVDASSGTYGRVVGWAEVPNLGDELHHFGWNACLCAQARGTRRRRLGPTVPARPGNPVLQSVCLRHLARSAAAAVDQDGDRRGTRRQGRVFAAAHVALRPGRGVSDLLGRCRVGGAGGGSPCWITTPSTSWVPGRPTAVRSISPTTPGGNSTRTL